MTRPYSQQKAMVIGISRYTDPQYDLTYARSDAEAVAALLKSDFGFQQVWELYDGDATRSRILKFFENELQQADEDDGIFVFFAGHGVTVTSGIGDDRGFLVPHDGDPKQAFANLSLVAIRDDYLPMIPAKHVFLAVDACYGGLAMRDVSVAERVDRIDDVMIANWTRREHKTRQVLAAGTKDQQVLDGGLFGHSVFTGRLLEAMMEANPFTTADKIGVSVRERVARDAHDRHVRQTPQFGYLAGGEGSFVFRREDSGTAIASGPPRETQHVQQTPTNMIAGSWEAFVEEHKLDDRRVLDALNEWSEKERKYLAPLEEYADIQMVARPAVVRVEFRSVTEERALEYETLAWTDASAQDVAEFREDIWQIPFRPPEGISEKTYTWRASKPARASACSTCGGSGEWRCKACNGTGEIECKDCSGTGKLHSVDGSKSWTCDRCDGSKVMRCPKCKGQPTGPCQTCGTSGKTVEYPKVTVNYGVQSQVQDIGKHACNDDDTGLGFWEGLAEGRRMPELPAFLPKGLASQIGTHFSRFMNGIPGHVCRTSVSLSLIPMTQCDVLYKERPYRCVVAGHGAAVRWSEASPAEWIKTNSGWMWGAGIGLPVLGFILAVTFAAGGLTQFGAALFMAGFLGGIVGIAAGIYGLAFKPARISGTKGRNSEEAREGGK